MVLSGDSASAQDADMWYIPGPFGLATVAALGNPPQPFRLYVDLLWDTLFVPNASLSTQYCSPGFEMFRYRANESSTAKPTDLGWYHMEQNLVVFSGPAALDTFRIGGGDLRVERQPFVAVEHAQPASLLHLWMNYDGVLGLSPRWNSPAEPTASHLPSPWARMVRDGVLDDNVFAIEVPRAARGGFDYDGSNGDVGPTAGAMTFGGVADKYRDAEFATLPLVVRDDDRAWAVAAHSVRWANQTQPIDYRFNASTIAVFSTQWIIGLPGPLAARIHRSIPEWAGKQCGMGLLCFINCAARRHLPDLVFELAGQSFTVTAFQYAYRVVDPKGEGISAPSTSSPRQDTQRKGGRSRKTPLF
ncbi:hypothetical protein PG984_008366 [Apiospora sp. TS-2023a]